MGKRPAQPGLAASDTGRNAFRSRDHSTSLNLPFGASTAPNSSRAITSPEPKYCNIGRLFMTHFFLHLNENQWSLVRETLTSQKFKVTTSDGKELGVDVHYTMAKHLRA